MFKALALMLTGAACAIGGVIASDSLGDASAAPTAKAAASDAQIRAAFVATARNTAAIQQLLRSALVAGDGKSLADQVNEINDTLGSGLGVNLHEDLQTIDRDIKTLCRTSAATANQLSTCGS